MNFSNMYVGRFHKVSFEQFCAGMIDMPAVQARMDSLQEVNSLLRELYDHIRLPERATAGSAGYDFRLPIDITLAPGESIKIPTGIRVEIAPRCFLACFPRSGLGFKYRLQLNNTVGIIDSDYFDSDNEGHIFAKLTNDSREGKTLQLKMGDAFMQGIFLPFGLADGDHATAARNGGMGSTGN